MFKINSFYLSIIMFTLFFMVELNAQKENLSVSYSLGATHQIAANGNDIHLHLTRLITSAEASLDTENKGVFTAVGKFWWDLNVINSESPTLKILNSYFNANWLDGQIGFTVGQGNILSFASYFLPLWNANNSLFLPFLPWQGITVEFKPKINGLDLLVIAGVDTLADDAEAIDKVLVDDWYLTAYATIPFTDTVSLDAGLEYWMDTSNPTSGVKHLYLIGLNLNIGSLLSTFIVHDIGFIGAEDNLADNAQIVGGGSLTLDMLPVLQPKLKAEFRVPFSGETAGMYLDMKFHFGKFFLQTVLAQEFDTASKTDYGINLGGVISF